VKLRATLSTKYTLCATVLQKQSLLAPDVPPSTSEKENKQAA